MIGTVRIVAPPTLGIGFGLTGIRTLEATDGLSAAQQVRRCLQDDDVAIILIDQSLEQAMPSEMRRKLARLEVPVVVPVPPPSWVARETEDTYIAELLRRAIGYRIRL